MPGTRGAQRSSTTTASTVAVPISSALGFVAERSTATVASFCHH
jgi:hypothetical protein